MLDSLVFGSKKNENYTKGAHLNGGEHNVYGIRIVLKRRRFYEREKTLGFVCQGVRKMEAWRIKYAKQIKKKTKKRQKNEKKKRRNERQNM